MTNIQYFTIFLCIILLLGCQPKDAKPDYLLKQHETLMREVVIHLASDEMRGREAGTVYAQNAATYITDKMLEIGLVPWKGSAFTQCFSPEEAGSNLPYCNVIGSIEGKGNLASEWVVVSAHYDHIGIQKEVEGDSIANGADDDATGIASMLSIAHYMKEATASMTNHRGLLFIAFDAEEKGLIGSTYFGEEFLGTQLPTEKVIAGINLEMLGKIAKGGPATAFMTGFDRSSLFDLMKPQMKLNGIELQPDPFPKFKLFYRSDNASLAKKGIPAHTISTDPIDEDRYYHTVDDEIGTIEFDNMTKVVKSIALGMLPLVQSAEVKPSRIATEQK